MQKIKLFQYNKDIGFLYRFEVMQFSYYVIVWVCWWGFKVEFDCIDCVVEGIEC